MIMDATENHYRDIVECQQDFLVKFSQEGRLLFVNSAYCEALGKSPEELVGSVFMPVTDERYADVVATQMTKLFRPPFACVVEQWIQTRKGMRCISWSARSILDKDKNVCSIVAAGRDVTSNKNEQKSLRKRDEELLLVLESGSQMYYSHTPDHCMAYVSPRIRTLLGCRSGEGKRVWTDFLTDNPANAAGLERTLRAITSGRREPPYRLEMVTGRGKQVWVEANEIPVVRNGKTVAIAGYLVDVTEKMHVEEGTAEAEVLFRGVREKEPETGSRSPFSAIRSIFSRDKAVEEEKSDLPDSPAKQH
ncbi:PAS domain-containing protein [uncultured Methanoregula sp.]|uniref:PAS domain-containing protein n=1 Tax=uncultured Methanoregula sp. TaxID=1005933 RepID=UPI002AAA7A49|nr:PAS domain-containing protein [uncultured Methanoregula sp.]